MAAGQNTQGRRYPDVADASVPHPVLPEGGYRRLGGIWHVRPPGTRHEGSIGKHDVTEHEDGTITVTPSILLETTWAGELEAWHGYLERGVWREV